jgi:hypothetical protein
MKPTIIHSENHQGLYHDKKLDIYKIEPTKPIDINRLFAKDDDPLVDTLYFIETIPFKTYTSAVKHMKKHQGG